MCVCNPRICTAGLTQFDLSDSELERLRTKRWNFSTSTTRTSDGDSASITSSNALSLDQPTGLKGKRTIGDLHLNCSLNSWEGVGQKGWSLDSPLPLDSPSSIDTPGIEISISSPADCSPNVFISEAVGKDKHPLELEVALPTKDAGISASVNRVKTDIRDKDDDSHHHHHQETDSLRILGLVNVVQQFPLQFSLQLKCPL